MTTSIKEQSIKPSWPVEQIRQMNVKEQALHMVARVKMMEEKGETELPKSGCAVATGVAKQLKQKGVKTPLDLVRHMAEHDANLYGADVAISGDDTKASLILKTPTVWLAVKDMKELSPEEEKVAGKMWRDWLTQFGKEFGFGVDVETTPDDTSAKITFSRGA
jgi:hypothetical protein